MNTESILFPDGKWWNTKLPDIDEKGVMQWPAESSIEWQRLVYVHKKIYENKRSFPRASIKEALLGISPQYPSDASVNELKLKMKVDFPHWENNRY